jgi:hypothetical protein
VNVVDILVGPVFKIIDKLIPDPKAKIEAHLALLKMQQEGEFKALEAELAIATGQIETNKIEAASTSFFRGGWRPAVGWVCVTGLGVTFVARPLLPWSVGLWGVEVQPIPELNTTELMGLLFGMLGLGGLRTAEKMKGVS